MSNPANGGKRWMSFTFESAPSMFDCPAKMKTRTVFVSPSAAEFSALKAAHGASNMARRNELTLFIN